MKPIRNRRFPAHVQRGKRRFSIFQNNTIFEALNVDFAALKAATKGSPWMGPSFAWTDQDPRGPWTRCSTRPCLPLQTRETVRQANGLRNVDWTFGKFLLLCQNINRPPLLQGRPVFHHGNFAYSLPGNIRLRIYLTVYSTPQSPFSPNQVREWGSIARQPS